MHFFTAVFGCCALFRAFNWKNDPIKEVKIHLCVLRWILRGKCYESQCPSHCKGEQQVLQPAEHHYTMLPGTDKVLCGCWRATAACLGL